MQQVSWVKQLVLAVALVVLGSASYWLVYKEKPKSEEAEEAAKKFFSIKGEQIKTIRLSDGKTTFEFDCLDLGAQLCKPGDNSKWDLSAPEHLRADDSNVNSLLSTLNNMSQSDTIDLKDETAEKRVELLKEYGLAPDALQSPQQKSVEVITAKGSTIAYFGNLQPVGDNYYTVSERIPPGQKPTGKVDMEKVALAPGYFKSNFGKDLSWWRDKKLMSFAPSEIQTFTLSSAKAGMVTAEREHGAWFVKTGKGEIPGDIENLDGFLSAVSYLTAKTFADEHKDSTHAREILAKSRPVATLTLQRVTGATLAPGPSVPSPSASSAAQPEVKTEEVVLNLMEKPGAPAPKEPKDKQKGAREKPATEGQLFATVSNSDALFELQPAARMQLEKGEKDFRLQKLITSMTQFNSSRMEFSGARIGTSPLVLKKVSGNWAPDPADPTIDATRGQATLDKLAGNRVLEIRSMKASQIAADSATGLRFQAGDDTNPRKRELVFWQSGKELLAHDVQGDPDRVYVVEPTLRDSLPWSRDYFHNAAAPSPSPAASGPTLRKPPMAGQKPTGTP